MGAEKAVGIIGAILGGYSSGVIQAELERQKREEELQLQAMRLATTRSGLQTDALNRARTQQQMAGYESPGEGRRLDTADWQGRQRFGWARDEEVAAAEQAAAQGREQTWMDTLPSALSSQHQVRRTLAVSQPQQAPGQGPLGSGQFGLNRMLQQTLAPGAVEPLSVSREATIAPTDPLFRQLHQAGVEYKPVPSPVTGRATPEITQVLTPAQREEQRLGLAEQRTGVAQAGLDLERSEATFEPDVRSAWAGAQQEETAAGLASATAPYDLLTAQAEAEQAGVDVDTARADFQRGEAADMMAGRMLTEGTPAQQSQAVAYILDQGFSISRQELSPEMLELRYQELDVKLQQAASSLQVAAIGADSRVTVAQISAQAKVVTEQLRQAGISGRAGGTTSAQDGAARAAQKMVEELYADVIEGNAYNLQAITPALKRLIGEAGPAGPAVSAYVVSLIRQAAAEDPDLLEGVSLEDFLSGAAAGMGKDRGPSTPTGADAVPFATAPARSPRRGAPPGLR